MTEAVAISELAQQAITPHTLFPGTVYAIADGDNGIKLVDTDAWHASPRRTFAHRTVSDSESFVNYLAKHGLDETEVYANTPSSSVVAVINSHQGAKLPAGWQDHRLTLVLEHTKSWLAWTEKDGKWFSQIEFAEFIEQHATDVAEPAAGDLLSLAQNFYMTKDVEFASSERLDNGETNLVYKEKVQSRGLGTIEVPKELKLVMQPYVNGPRQFAFANFRVRLDGALLRIGYVLIRPEEILEGVFVDIVNEIRDGRTVAENAPIRPFQGITAPIYYGKP